MEFPIPQDDTHDEWAEEAESAQRAEAWPQAAALWRRAAEKCDDPDQKQRYEAEAYKCDAEVSIDQLLEGIARRIFGIETLTPRNIDRLDFHEVGGRDLLHALRLAFRAGAAERRT